MAGQCLCRLESHLDGHEKSRGKRPFGSGLLVQDCFTLFAIGILAHSDSSSRGLVRNSTSRRPGFFSFDSICTPELLRHRQGCITRCVKNSQFICDIHQRQFFVLLDIFFRDPFFNFIMEISQSSSRMAGNLGIGQPKTFAAFCTALPSCLACSASVYSIVLLVEAVADTKLTLLFPLP